MAVACGATIRALATDDTIRVISPRRARSVRVLAEVWENLEQRAKREGIPLHAALRAAVLVIHPADGRGVR
jgi:hypothetical protein